MGPSLLFTIATGREQMHQQPWQQTLVVLLHMHILGCVRLENLDLDFKVQISDLQSNAKSENVFQRQNFCFLDFPFYRSNGKSKKGFEKLSLRTAVLHAHA